MAMKTGPALITGDNRRQAGTDDAPDLAAVRRDGRGYAAARRAEHYCRCQRPRCADDQTQGHRQGLFHWLDRDRQEGDGICSSSIKRLTLELGGNDAAIVLDDVDVKAVAPKIFDAAMSNAGQICLATKRVYARSSIDDELCAELARLAGEAVVDDRLNQGTTVGPIQNKMQYEKVKGFLEDARTNGKVIAGGQALERQRYFIAPTIVRDIGDDARLVREEQFGPILPVLSFEDVEGAIARANDTDYGLGGSVWTADVERGVAVASKVESGTVWVNKWLDMPFDVPFRGAKQSGIGAENGQEGIEEYTQARIINIAL
jgi:acyl-CoA reductase-like NAD-dependent aldehyde dehydrogenase